jgi:hypothetical protein
MGASRLAVLGTALLLLAGCGGAAESDADPRVPVPTGLESGCPPPETPLRYPGGDLPAGALAVRLCPGQPTIAYTGDPLGPPIQAPVDELTTGVEQLVELVNGLPHAPRKQACHLDDGPHHVYWFRYPDGDARAVAYDEAGCHTAVVGEDVGRENGEELATAFADALLAQRAGATPPARDGDSAPSCRQHPLLTPSSVLPAVPLEMTAATWCVGAARNRMRSAPVSTQLLSRLNAGLLGAPTEGRERCEMTPYGTWLVGTTAWGDRVQYDVFGCRVQARTGYGRDHMMTVYEADPELLAALRALPLGPPERHEDSPPKGDGAVVEPSLDPLSVPACPSWDAEPDYPDGPVPTGAVSLRVCPGEKTLSGPRTWKPAIAPPLDALTTGVGDVIDLLNGLPDFEGLPEGTFCTQEGRPRIHYVFGYLDGSTRSVTYGYGECHLLELGRPGELVNDDAIAKADAAPFMDAVSAALVEQRQGTRPPQEDREAPRCVPNARPFTTLPIQELELDVAALCELDRRGWRRAIVPPALVTRLADEYSVAEEPADQCPSAYVGKVVGWSTWGDPVEMHLWDRCAVLGSPWSTYPGNPSWTPSSDLVDEFLALELGPPVRQR